MRYKLLVFVTTLNSLVLCSLCLRMDSTYASRELTEVPESTDSVGGGTTGFEEGGTEGSVGARCIAERSEISKETDKEIPNDEEERDDKKDVHVTFSEDTKQVRDKAENCSKDLDECDDKQEGDEEEGEEGRSSTEKCMEDKPEGGAHVGTHTDKSLVVGESEKDVERPTVDAAAEVDKKVPPVEGEGEEEEVRDVSTGGETKPAVNTRTDDNTSAIQEPDQSNEQTQDHTSCRRADLDKREMGGEEAAKMDSGEVVPSTQEGVTTALQQERSDKESEHQVEEMPYSAGEEEGYSTRAQEPCKEMGSEVPDVAESEYSRTAEGDDTSGTTGNVEDRELSTQEPSSVLASPHPTAHTTLPTPPQPPLHSSHTTISTVTFTPPSSPPPTLPSPSQGTAPSPTASSPQPPELSPPTLPTSPPVTTKTNSPDHMSSVAPNTTLTPAAVVEHTVSDTTATVDTREHVSPVEPSTEKAPMQQEIKAPMPNIQAQSEDVHFSTAELISASDSVSTAEAASDLFPTTHDHDKADERLERTDAGVDERCSETRGGSVAKVTSEPPLERATDEDEVMEVMTSPSSQAGITPVERDKSDVGQEVGMDTEPEVCVGAGVGESMATEIHVPTSGPAVGNQEASVPEQHDDEQLEESSSSKSTETPSSLASGGDAASEKVFLPSRRRASDSLTSSAVEHFSSQTAPQHRASDTQSSQAVSTSLSLDLVPTSQAPASAIVHEATQTPPSTHVVTPTLQATPPASLSSSHASTSGRAAPPIVSETTPTPMLASRTIQSARPLISQAAQQTQSKSTHTAQLPNRDTQKKTPGTADGELTVTATPVYPTAAQLSSGAYQPVIQVTPTGPVMTLMPTAQLKMLSQAAERQKTAAPSMSPASNSKSGEAKRREGVETVRAGSGPSFFTSIHRMCVPKPQTFESTQVVRCHLQQSNIDAVRSQSNPTTSKSLQSGKQSMSSQTKPTTHVATVLQSGSDKDRVSAPVARVPVVQRAGSAEGEEERGEGVKIDRTNEDASGKMTERLKVQKAEILGAREFLYLYKCDCVMDRRAAHTLPLWQILVCVSGFTVTISQMQQGDFQPNPITTVQSQTSTTGTKLPPQVAVIPPLVDLTKVSSEERNRTRL